MKPVLDQLNISPDPRAIALKLPHCYQYRWHTIEGTLIAHKGEMTVLFIGNDHPGNGEFVKFIELLEEGARTGNYKLRVQHFIEPRLRAWFIRRGYRFHPKRDRVSYQPKQGAAHAHSA